MADYSRDFSITFDDARQSCSIRFRCFDTPNSVTLYGFDDPVKAEAVLLAVRQHCLRFHELWSFSLPESDISRINENCEQVEVSVETALLVQGMKSFNECEPLFDFTIGPVSFVWKHAQLVPEIGDIEEALGHVGVGNVAIELPQGDALGPSCQVTIRKLDPKSRIDVGGAAKGYVADAIVSFLRTMGVQSADIDLGGNLFMMGLHPANRPWRVSVRIPEGVKAEKVIVEVCDKSVVTSGSYERFVEIGGKVYQHIVDPTTGWPSESDVVSATVISSSSFKADMLATTALLVGSVGFDSLARRHADCGFVIITRSGDVFTAGLNS